MMAACTTASRPAWSAKKPMNSSGRLPSALCSTPVAPAPNRSPSCSTLRPTSEASMATATAATANVRTAGAAGVVGDAGQEDRERAAADDHEVRAGEQAGHATMIAESGKIRAGSRYGCAPLKIGRGDVGLISCSRRYEISR